MAEVVQKITNGQKAYLKRIVNDFQKDAQKAFDKLSSLKDNLLAVKEGLPSLPEQFESAAIEIKESRYKIESLYNKIFVPIEPGEVSSAEGITSFVNEYERVTNSIGKLHARIEQHKIDLFGYTNKEGEEIAGIQDKINIQIAYLMAKYKITNEAKNDLIRIDHYGVEKFGMTETDQYFEVFLNISIVLLNGLFPLNLLII